MFLWNSFGKQTLRKTRTRQVITAEAWSEAAKLCLGKMPATRSHMIPPFSRLPKPPLNLNRRNRSLKGVQKGFFIKGFIQASVAWKSDCDDLRWMSSCFVVPWASSPPVSFQHSIACRSGNRSGIARSWGVVSSSWAAAKRGRPIQTPNVSFLPFFILFLFVSD